MTIVKKDLPAETISKPPGIFCCIMQITISLCTFFKDEDAETEGFLPDQFHEVNKENVIDNDRFAEINDLCSNPEVEEEYRSDSSNGNSLTKLNVVYCFN